MHKMLCALLLMALSPVVDAAAAWGPFRVGVSGETGRLVFDELSEFTGFVEGASGQPDRSENLRYELEDTGVDGFALQVELGDEFRLSWSRQTGKSRLAAIIDGVDIQDDPNADPVITIPAVELRVDLISLSYHPRRLRWHGLGPYLRAGYGWVLTHRQPLPARLRGQRWDHRAHRRRGVALAFPARGRGAAHPALALGSGGSPGAGADHPRPGPGGLAGPLALIVYFRMTSLPRWTSPSGALTAHT